MVLERNNNMSSSTMSPQQILDSSDIVFNCSQVQKAADLVANQICQDFERVEPIVLAVMEALS